MEHSTTSRLENSEMTGPVSVAQKVNRVPRKNWAILAVLISAFTKPLTSYTAVRAHAPITERVRPPYRDADEQLIRIRPVPCSDVLVPPVHLWTRDLPACIRSASAASSRKPQDILTERE